MGLKLEEVAAALGDGRLEELFRPHWEESAASLPAGGPSFLDRDEFTASREFIALTVEADAALVQTARRVRGDPALLHLAWHCYRLLFHHRDYDGGHCRQWPNLEGQLGELAGVFYLLILLSAVPLIRELHKAQGVPEGITRDTCGHFADTARFNRQAHGKWGFDPRVIFWLRHHTAGELYGLGRMEYMVRPFRGRLEAFRNGETGEVVALAEDGVKFDREGFVDPDATDGWTARFLAEDGAVTGCPISPTGVGVQREVELPLATWQRVLKPGDFVCEMHIPAGGNMTPERCEASMRQALEFLPGRFPDRPIVGFGCGSWILNPELEWIYSPSSNMVLWQRELYLYPLASDRRSGVYFAFGKDELDLATAPRDTSLQRALLDHLAAGGRLRSGGMFMLKEDFEHYGTQYYRTRWPF